MNCVNFDDTIFKKVADASLVLVVTSQCQMSVTNVRSSAVGLRKSAQANQYHPDIKSMLSLLPILSSVEPT